MMDAGCAPVDSGGSQAEAVFHGERDAGGVLFLYLGEADEDVGSRIGVVEVEGRIDVAAGGHDQARVLFGAAQVVGVFELDVGRGAQNVAWFPVGAEDIFLHRIGGCPGTPHAPPTGRTPTAPEVWARFDSPGRRGPAIPPRS